MDGRNWDRKLETVLLYLFFFREIPFPLDRDSKKVFFKYSPPLLHSK